ncbi:Serine/threonine-protein kinase KIN4 [Candida viswanathii]|uniref:non-specific serine/threonine protein kinase n=1 Tax=Candida viswanathii TaxID=5486 RepID=A0A367YBE8_9ASCO|nr:Serine/threonine-protein kinase KIN4 [Candida viswanathii]
MSTIIPQVEMNFNQSDRRQSKIPHTTTNPPSASASASATTPRTVEIPPMSSIPQSTSTSSIQHANIAKKIHREVRFGAYILGSTLGEGEFGKVKLGWRKDGKHPSQVAIKLIKRSSIMKDSDSEIKIHREINSLKLLNHPNIVNLVEVMKSGKYIGIVLEYASGGELFDYILQHKYLKENVAKKLFAQLVSGVDYMHAKGLIHRDLKLENLLLDKHKNVIISDFGFVNSYNRDKNDLMKTSCGSPCYAAPELVLSQTAYEGRKVDIWSLGVILYAMLSGYLPFDDDPENEDGADIIKLYHYICKTPLTFPEYVSPLARDLLRKIIVSDPKKRIGIDEIRNHPWLSSYANLLSVRQPEWDKVHKEKQQPPVVIEQPQANKRYSMINERTNSSSLMAPAPRLATNNYHPHHQQQQQPLVTPSPQSQVPQPISSHSRSYSSTSISLLYSSPTSSMVNTVAVPKLNESNDALALSQTPSPKKPSSVSPTRGHQKSASMSHSYSSASTALKAVVFEENKQLQQQYIPRSTTISTIVESPTKAAPTASTILLAPPSKALPKLPHATKKPRPTSYHPSSMTSTLIQPTSNPTDVLKIPAPTPSNLAMTQYISTSPPKSDGSTESTNNYNHINNSNNSISSRAASRRNSVVTHVHVNGVLSKENLMHSSSSPDNKRNSVLSYLEDKIDTLELTESHSPTKLAFEEIVDAAIATPEINQVPAFDSLVSPHDLDSADSKTREMDETIQQMVQEDSKETMIKEPEQEKQTETQLMEEVKECDPIVPVEEYIKKPEEEVKVIQVAKPERAASTKKKVKEESVKKQKDSDARPIERRHTVAARRQNNHDDKENKEAKKRNRFSLLSFYSSYNSSSSNISLTEPTTNTSTNSSGAAPKKKVLEPSNEANIIKKDQKRVGSNGSNSSKRQNPKETSAAKKVMDFFKRRSIRVG